MKEHAFSHSLDLAMGVGWVSCSDPYLIWKLSDVPFSADQGRCRDHLNPAGKPLLPDLPVLPIRSWRPFGVAQ